MSVRLPSLLRQQLDSEFRRQMRKKEFVVSCALQHFLTLPLDERDRVCSMGHLGYALPGQVQPVNGRKKETLRRPKAERRAA
jgi:hypothetical protein